MKMSILIITIAISGIANIALAGSTSSFAETIERAKAATVAILKETHPEFSPARRAHFSIRGSGFHLQDGYIITAGHAVERQEGSQVVMPKQIHVLTQDLFEIPASFVGFNDILDIAVYRLKQFDSPPPLPATSFAHEEVRSGDNVFTIGYPLGWGPAMGFGTIGNPNTFLPTVQSRLHQVDLSICSGNSGGGLFNHQGEIIGVVHAIIQTETTESDRRCSRFAFAVPGALVQKIITALIQGSSLKFSTLGIQLTTKQENHQWKVAVAKARGPAQTGGVRKGDVILSIENYPIHTPAELKTFLIEQTTPGQRITLQIQRGKIQHALLITLGGL